MAKEKTIRIYPLHVGDFSYKKDFETIENTLEAKQKFVGGTIQGICFDREHKLDIILNDDGKLIGLPLNRAWIIDNIVVDIIVGEAFICRHDDKGNYCSIQEEDLDIIFNTFKPILLYLGVGVLVEDVKGFAELIRMRD